MQARKQGRKGRESEADKRRRRGNKVTRVRTRIIVRVGETRRKCIKKRQGTERTIINMSDEKKPFREGRGRNGKGIKEVK